MDDLLDLRAELHGLRAAWREYLLETAGRNLTRRPLLVQLRPSAVAGHQATTYRDGERAVIQLDPELQPERLLWVFLHELGHVAKHWRWLVPTKEHEQPPGTVEPDPVIERWEDKAEALAAGWFERATRTGGSLEDWLINLLDGEK